MRVRCSVVQVLREAWRLLERCGSRAPTARALLPSAVMLGTNRRRTTWLSALLAASTCGGGGDLPPGWTDAHPLQVAGSQCIGAPSGEPTRLELTPREGGRVGVKFRTTAFRCGQRACAYVLDQGTTAKLLVQPCEMHPQLVDKCVCISEVSLELEENAATEVELWLRSDDYGQTGPNPPRLVDTAFLRSMCGGENPSERCRTSPDDCLPSVCACDQGAWVCTADCGGGRTCLDGGLGPDTAPEAR